jgi:hypothetical protein
MSTEIALLNGEPFTKEELQVVPLVALSLRK